ncbi:MAG: phage integrase central domain-containing protein [Methylocella sp.]
MALAQFELTAPEVLAVLRTVEARGRRETARRLRATIGEVFRATPSPPDAPKPTQRARSRALSLLRSSNIAPPLSSRRPSAGFCAP